ncbi:hypothetical protein SISNIDRAFT_482151 [Sistotremastrum niveocremeum HHB9708]|uniref:E3 ubiquitin-protein ligase listerin n=1 Tax=Sistotremastrum niveocremeum HHB9708 TaxID=1314777 RepID=A0A164YTJ9_9AGAM|nr:hypothetical protein SISNIDRAFT_482151 [Sistotremastrum niveocremeum HHB9708]
MPKPNKSSATSSTRKKHAKKAAGPSETHDDPKPKDKKLKGKDKKQPKIKSYIPPTKPAPIQPDPLDSLGLANSLPADLVVILRRLAKKDNVTKRRALEDLQSLWVDKAGNEDILDIVEIMLPIWLHHLPILLLHQSRRLRLLASGLHTSLLALPRINSRVVSALRDGDFVDGVETFIGAWCMAVHDIDRQVAIQARKSWNMISISNDDGIIRPLLAFLRESFFDPEVVYNRLNPPRVPGTVNSSRATSKAGTPMPDDEPSLRAKGENEEEEEADRHARLRFGALGSLRWVLECPCATVLWPDLNVIFESTAFWSALSCSSEPPFSPSASYGHGIAAVPVRKAAWSLLQSLLSTSEGRIQGLIDVVGPAVVRSAWIESDAIVRSGMWEPLVVFLSKFPQSWTVPPRVNEDADADDSESDTEHHTDVPSKHDRHPHDEKAAYREFLEFLELGCGGSPLQGYPTIMIVISTLPSRILPLQSEDLRSLFTSFWAAIDGRALNTLNRVTISAAFLSALLECVLFIVAKIRRQEGSHNAACTELIAEQFDRMWSELTSRRLKVNADQAGQEIAKALLTLQDLNEGLLRSAWKPLESSSLQLFVSSDDSGQSAEYAVEALTALYHGTSGDNNLGAMVEALITDSSRHVLSAFEDSVVDDEAPSALEVNTEKSLELLLGRFSFLSEEGSSFLELLDQLIQQSLRRLLLHHTPLVISYLGLRDHDGICSSVWADILGIIGGLESNDPKQIQILDSLLKAHEAQNLPDWLRPTGGELDSVASRLLHRALAGGSNGTELTVLIRLLKIHSPYIVTTVARSIVDSVSSAWSRQFLQLLLDASVDVNSLYAPLRLLSELLGSQSELCMSDAFARGLLPDVYLLGYLMPASESAYAGNTVVELAQGLWLSWSAGVSESLLHDVTAMIVSSIRDILRDTQVRPTPYAVLDSLIHGPTRLSFDLFTDLIPAEKDLNSLLNAGSPVVVDSTASVLDPFYIPATEPDESTPRKRSPQYDSLGFSEYSRIVMAILKSLSSDRQLIKENIWSVRHVMILGNYAADLLRFPQVKSPLFGTDLPKDVAEDIASKVNQIVAYVLSYIGEDAWHIELAATLTASASDSQSRAKDPASMLLQTVYTASVTGNNARDALVLLQIMQLVLSDVSKASADLWVQLARSIEAKSSETSLAITYALTRAGPEPPRLDRLRNELASTLAGVPNSKANKEGRRLLRRLAASAPNPDGDVVFLPQQRAIFLVQTFQKWIASDEELDIGVENLMTLMFFYLAPILQNLPGSHWELIFDIMENNLENASFEDDSTLFALFWTLRLIISLEDLTASNKALKAEWVERRSTMLRFVRDLLLVTPVHVSYSEPREKCRELLLNAVQDLPSSLLEHDTLPKMCHLLLDPSDNNRKLSYQLLKQASARYTESLVVEAGVDTQSSTKIQLPSELMVILQSGINSEDNHGAEHVVDSSTYLLGWMIAMDLFIDTSLKVKMAYLDGLREAEVIGNNLLPVIFDLLGVSTPRRKPLNLSPWAVDEYFIDLYEPADLLSNQLLASHIYYRVLMTVPSLVRSWWLECTDRQLTSSVSSFTSGSFSPVIIAQQLSHIRQPDVQAELNDENMTIKVSSGFNEVSAVYLIDEQQMEIGVKLPGEYPLKPVEVRDVRKVGVKEDRWRAWLFAVQQVISSQNGRIFDALSLFKKNVSLHFEGQVECAICYSIISVSDRTLPDKPCKTCKNRFHASCLYKWFNTSHASTCPLCRSEM